MYNWNVVITPNSFLKEMASGVVWGVVTSRWANWHDMAHTMLEDSELSVVCRRYLAGDAPPWPGAHLRPGTLVVDIVDKSGVNIGTSHGGTVFDGLIRTVAEFTDDFLDSTINVIADADTPQDYILPGFKYCVDEQTEILTKRGWLRHEDLSPGDETLGLGEDGTVSWTTVDQVSTFPGHHEMIAWKTRGHDSLTTPDHKWLVEYCPTVKPPCAVEGCEEPSHRRGWCVSHLWHWQQYGDPLVGPFRKKRKKTSGRRWITSSQLGDSTTDTVICARPLVEYPEQKYSDALVELVAWYWTEGYFRGPSISIAQSKAVNPENWASIHAALISCFGECSPSRRGQEFYIKGEHAEHIWRHAPGKNKALSVDFILSLTKAQLQLFVDTSIRGDGHVQRRGERVMNSNITQKRRESLDVLQIACQLLGKQTVLSQERPDRWRLSVYEKSRTRPHRAKAAGKITRVEYDGVVWCPTTLTGTWLARRNGTVYFTGNTAKEKPYVIFQEGENSAIETSAFIVSPAKGVQVNVGGHSMPGVNEAISATIQATFDILGGLVQIGSLGGTVDALLKPIYEDTILAWWSVKNFNRAQHSGWSRYFEYFQDVGGQGMKAYTIASLMVLRAGFWATKTTTTWSVKVADGRPFVIGDLGLGHFFLDDRVGLILKGSDEIHMDRCRKLDLAWDEENPPEWSIDIGDPRILQDPGQRAWSKIEALVAGLRDLGVY